MSLLMHEDLVVDELVLLHDRRNVSLIDHLRQDALEIHHKPRLLAIR
jgi:transcriptional regulatory protein RtcR